MFVKQISSLFVLILICAARMIASPSVPTTTSPAVTSAQPTESITEAETPEVKTISLADQAASCAEPSENPMTAPNVFSWQLFISINACGSQPQWTGWKSVEQVYLPNGAAPKPWGDPPPPDVRPLQNAPEISGHCARSADGKPLLYDVLMNEPTFEYIVDRQFYSRAGQINFFNDQNAPIVEFPWDALEIKTVWLILDPKSPSVSRYYTINASFVDDKGVVQNVLVGLAGMHISSKAIPNWVWATFEQIDNASTTLTPVVNPIPADVQAVNNEAQLALREQSGSITHSSAHKSPIRMHRVNRRSSQTHSSKPISRKHHPA